MSVQQQLTRKYAQAWLAVYPDDMSVERFIQCQKAAAFFKQHHHFSLHLQLSVISDADKQKALQELFVAFDLPDSLNKLVDLLLSDKRLRLIGAVLDQIAQVYAQKQRIQTFVFESSTQLSDEYCAVLQRFLAAKTGCVIIYEKRVDKSLIAGIRLASSTTFWEYSLAQQLRRLQHALMQ